MERVGFVGLGIMGAPMARNAIKAGFPVTVTNRTLDRAKPFEEAGATVVRTPREVAEHSDLVVTMVTSSPDVEAVTFGPDGIAAGAHSGLLAIDMSTISPAASRVIAKRAAASRPPFHTLDAPVSITARDRPASSRTRSPSRSTISASRRRSSSRRRRASTWSARGR